MFTGLVEEISRVEAVSRRADSASLRIAAGTVLEGTRVGDSISVSGVCLTVTRVDRPSFDVEMVPETVARTNLPALKAGDWVNLERSLKLGARVGGHLVLGHVDGLARVVRVEGPRSPETLLRLHYPKGLGTMIAEKGSVAVEGVSLTVAAVDEEAFSVALIPYTLKATTLGRAKVGDELNLEVDVFARYVARHLSRGAGSDTRLTEDWMRSEGYV